jgi:hypothetical protein
MVRSRIPQHLTMHPAGLRRVFSRPSGDKLILAVIPAVP